jgi:hypothetical protein
MVGKKLLMFAALVGSITFAAETVAKSVTSPKVENQQSALSEAIGKLKKSELSKVVQDASRVFQETNKALLFLQRGQKEEASVILNRVASELDKLVNEYGLIRVPIDVRFVEFSGITDLDLAWKYNKQVKKLVAGNDFVDARPLLALLRNEIDVITTYMPLGLYRDAIKLAIKLLNEGKIDYHPVAFVGDVVGTGSSRKSAANSVIWHIGNDIEGVPNKRNGGLRLNKETKEELRKIIKTRPKYRSRMRAQAFLLNSEGVKIPGNKEDIRCFSKNFI